MQAEIKFFAVFVRHAQVCGVMRQYAFFAPWCADEIFPNRKQFLLAFAPKKSYTKNTL